MRSIKLLVVAPEKHSLAVVSSRATSKHFLYWIGRNCTMLTGIESEQLYSGLAKSEKARTVEQVLGKKIYIYRTFWVPGKLPPTSTVGLDRTPPRASLDITGGLPRDANTCASEACTSSPMVVFFLGETRREQHDKSLLFHSSSSYLGQSEDTLGVVWSEGSHAKEYRASYAKTTHVGTQKRALIH